ncbi:hypothetical protein P7C71_g6191, partial [Lecanoromycetidae sp. Uapishka_2]
MTDPFGPNCDDSGPAIAIDGLENLCTETLDECPGGFPAAAGCVQTWCHIGCSDPDNCCASSNAQSCFQSSSGTPSSGSGNSNSGSGSGAAASLPAGADMCTSVLDQVSYCVSATPGFTTLPNSAQASCFCFNQDGSYNGTVWDMAASTCYQAMQSESVSAAALSSYENAVVGACTKFVDAGVLSSAGVKTGAAAATAGSTSKAAAAARTTAGAKAGTESSSSEGPTATAKSDAMGIVGRLHIGRLLTGVWAIFWVLL